MAVDEPGDQRAAARVDHEVGAGVVLERHDHLAAHRHRAGVEPHLAGAAHVGEPVLGREQDLGGVAERDRRRHGAIGIRTPSRSAASSASS